MAGKQHKKWCVNPLHYERKWSHPFKEYLINVRYCYYFQDSKFILKDPFSYYGHFSIMKTYSFNEQVVTCAFTMGDQ